MGKKTSRGFSITMEISKRIDKIIQDIQENREIIIRDTQSGTQLQFQNASQLVEWIFLRTLPQIEDEIRVILEKHR